MPSERLWARHPADLAYRDWGMQKISAEEWRQVFTLLDCALEIPAADRGAWLASVDQYPAPVIAALRDLLARQTADDFLQKLPQFTGSPDWPQEAQTESLDVGSAVGPYRLIGKLGRGGMSSVWIAERIDGSPKRRVALKLPHLNGALRDLTQRMARERDLLGSLEHPGIARLYDAGVNSDGRPYLALELVEGMPIDEYCHTRACDSTARASLLLQIARAVAYAHSHFIIHRDLKPANVLVDEAGQVHLLDFGIGKLLVEGLLDAPKDTLFIGRLFTPDYASPEQLRGEAVTVASDVFSLGVVMYQLLCGKLPFEARVAAAASDNSGVDPRPPSTMADHKQTRLALRGDLDTIVLKALKHIPSQRFATMDAFADDLDRYLRGVPVLARPDSAGYRLRKFTRRNRRTVLAVAATLCIAAAAGWAFYLRQSSANDAARTAAIEESADAMARRSVPLEASRDVEAYHDYLRARSLMLRSTDANLREILRLLQNATSRDPGFARAYSLMAGVHVLFLDLGYDHPEGLVRGEAIARQAIALDAKLPGPYATLGSIAAHRGQWLDAEGHFQLAFELDDGAGRVHARHSQTVLVSVGRVDQALRKYRADFRLTPAHARGAMQVAQGLAARAGNDAEATHYLEIALSLGWPAEEVDVRELYARMARRDGRYQEAASYLSLVLPESIRARSDTTLVTRLHEGLQTGAARQPALEALDEVAGRMRVADAESFAALMFLMNWYAMLGDLDRAYLTADRWVSLRDRSGLSGIPHNAGFWLDEMRAFRADPRFHDVTKRLGMIDYWRRFGVPDGCRLNARISCPEAAAGS
jgi:serine/threonine protein kinase/tetratricopeptide (TPR) repeat protein